GLYAYGRQPDALLWNLSRLAECMLSIAPQAELQRVLEGFAAEFRSRFSGAALRRLGLAPAGGEADQELAASMWRFLAETKIPFERFFFDWRGGMESDARADRSPSQEIYRSADFKPV